MSGFDLTLPWPPSANTHWRFMAMRGCPMVCLSKHGREYRKAVQAEVWKACGGKPVPLEGRISISIGLHAPDRRKRDIDNHIKALLDALTHAGCWIDDSQIDALTIERRANQPGGNATIIAMELA